MGNTTAILILSDGTHRVTRWDRTVAWAEVVRSVTDQVHSIRLAYVLKVIVALGADVTTYEGGEVDELFAGSQKKAR